MGLSPTLSSRCRLAQALSQEVRQLEQDLARCANELAHRLPAQAQSMCLGLCVPSLDLSRQSELLCVRAVTGDSSVQHLAVKAVVLTVLEAAVDALVQLTLLVRDVDVSLAEATSCSSFDERFTHFQTAVNTVQAACTAVR